MFNVTVLKMKDIIKYLVGITITIFFVIYTTRYFLSLKNNKKEENIKQSKIEVLQFGTLTSCLDKTIPTMSSINEENEKEEEQSTNYFEEFLKTEISSIKGIEKTEKNNNIEIKKETEKNEPKDEEKTEEITLANATNIKTEVVTENPISENYNAQYGNVKIKNQTTYELTEDMLKPDITIENKNILIFHTHSCERIPRLYK